MASRRKFIVITAAGAGGMVLGTGATAESIKTGNSDSGNITKPIVISTWDHGIAANKGAWEILSNNGKALDAVEKGVMVTEADLSNRSVGLGGRPDRDGNVTLDACVMDDQSRCGAVAFLQYIDHPISVARKVMENTPHVMMVGEGAYQFALAQGFKRSAVDVPVPKAKKAWREWMLKSNYELPINIENHDTIGMVALDAHGNLSGACTTSGLAYKLHGRVGDSPIIGAGLFVDNEVGAAIATGLGEAVIRTAGSHTVVELMRQGVKPEDACREAIERIIKKHNDLKNLQVGYLALNKNGEYGGYSVQASFNYAIRTSEREEMIDAKFKLKF